MTARRLRFAPALLHLLLLSPFANAVPLATPDSHAVAQDRTLAVVQEFESTIGGTTLAVTDEI